VNAGLGGDEPFVDNGDNVNDATVQGGTVTLVQTLVDYSFLWVPNAGDDTLSKLDTRTGKELAQYRICANAYRTAMDNDGFAWVTCMDDGGVVKVAALERDCHDRNGDGVIQTSRDVDDNGVIEGPELLAKGDDECLLFTVVPGGAKQWAIEVDEEKHAWAGHFEGKILRRLSPVDGATVKEIPINGSPFGLEIDDSGILWAACRTAGGLDRIDPDTEQVTTFAPPGANESIAGMTLDLDGNVWLSNGHLNGNLFRFRVEDEEFDVVTTNFSLGYPYGMTVDAAGHVYVGHHEWTCWNGRHVSRVDTETMQVVSEIALAPSGLKGPSGVTIDRDGFLWTANACGHSVSKVNLQTEEVVGEWPMGMWPTALNDFAMGVDALVAQEEGHYTHVFEATGPGLATWQQIDLDVDFPMGSLAEIRFKVAQTEDELEGALWYDPLGPYPVDDLPADISAEGIVGDFLLVVVSLYPGVGETTPTLNRISADYLIDETCGNGECDGNEDCSMCPEDCECIGGQTCVMGSCVDPLNDGDACDQDSWCESTQCVDGVCCEDSCDGECMECDQPGHLGECRQVENQADPDDECGLCSVCNGAGACTAVLEGNDPLSDCAQQSAESCAQDGECDGAAACRFWPVGTLCSLQSCVVSTLHPVDECDGNGACVDSGTTACEPYKCDDAGVSCRTECSESGHCEDGYLCNGDTCEPGLGDGQACTSDNQCANGHCDEDVAGVKRCHATETSCVKDFTGAETATGQTVCSGSSASRLCTNSSWAVPQGCTGCQSCQGAACADDDSLCVDSGFNGCMSACIKSKTSSGVCSDGTCETAVDFVSAGTVCTAGAEVPPSEMVNCDMSIDCVDNQCTADRFYRACAGGGDTCGDTNRVAAANWLAPAGTAISETQYAIGSSCQTASGFCSMTGHCVGDDWFGGYTCNGTGGCDVDYEDQGCCNHSDCGPVTEFCDVNTHACKPLPLCTVRSVTDYGYQPATDGQDPFAQCDEEAPTTCGNDGFCDGAGDCRKWALGTECMAAGCLDGETFRDVGHCNGTGGCVDGNMNSCCPYACEAGACRTDCTGIEHCCFPMFMCNGGECS